MDERIAARFGGDPARTPRRQRKKPLEKEAPQPQPAQAPGVGQKKKAPAPTRTEKQQQPQPQGGGGGGDKPGARPATGKHHHHHNGKKKAATTKPKSHHHANARPERNGGGGGHEREDGDDVSTLALLEKFEKPASPEKPEKPLSSEMKPSKKPPGSLPRGGKGGGGRGQGSREKRPRKHSHPQQGNHHHLNGLNGANRDDDAADYDDDDAAAALGEKGPPHRRYPARGGKQPRESTTPARQVSVETTSPPSDAYSIDDPSPRPSTSLTTFCRSGGGGQASSRRRQHVSAKKLDDAQSGASVDRGSTASTASVHEPRRGSFPPAELPQESSSISSDASSDENAAVVSLPTPVSAAEGALLLPCEGPMLGLPCEGPVLLPDGTPPRPTHRIRYVRDDVHPPVQVLPPGATPSHHRLDGDTLAAHQRDHRRRQQQQQQQRLRQSVPRAPFHQQQMPSEYHSPNFGDAATALEPSPSPPISSSSSRSGGATTASLGPAAYGLSPDSAFVHRGHHHHLPRGPPPPIKGAPPQQQQQHHLPQAVLTRSLSHPGHQHYFPGGAPPPPPGGPPLSSSEDVSVTFSSTSAALAYDSDDDERLARHLEHVYARTDFLLRQHAARATGDLCEFFPADPSAFPATTPTNHRRPRDAPPRSVVVVPGGFVATTSFPCPLGGLQDPRSAIVQERPASAGSYGRPGQRFHLPKHSTEHNFPFPPSVVAVAQHPRGGGPVSVPDRPHRWNYPKF